MKITYTLLLNLLLLNYATLDCFSQKPPKLTVIIEIDQFAYHYIPRLQKYLSGGIKFLLKNGIQYSNAYWPHAMPATAVGHVAINTGTFAYYHGIINNSWYDKKLNKISFEDDTAQHAAVFAPDGLYEYGKSAHNMVVDGLSDQLMLASTEASPIDVYALSYKSRAAIGNAGKLGKAIWFDTQTGRFTSSKAYFDQLPHWLVQFNKKISKNNLRFQKWRPFFKPNSKAYLQADNKQTAPLQRVFSVIGDNVEQLLNHDKPYESFIRTPPANKLLINLAKNFLNNHPYKNDQHRIVLWLSFSPLDKLGHFYGPHSKEILDMIYHLDHQLMQFFNFLHKQFNKTDILYLLTADHGVEPTPEYLHKKGLKNARRILIPQLCSQIEEQVQKEHGISIRCAIKTPQIYLDENFETLDKNQQKKVLKTIQKLVENQDGIRKVWTYTQLKKACLDHNTIDYYYKGQQYPGRSSHLIFQVQPYVQVTKYPVGTAHRTPYEWNTHVPLIFYQKNRLEHMEIKDRVWLLQTPNTLSQIHNVPKPSASTYALLPGIFQNVAYDNNKTK